MPDDDPPVGLTGLRLQVLPDLHASARDLDQVDAECVGPLALLQLQDAQGSALSCVRGFIYIY